MIGEKGEVYKDIPASGLGKVFVHGELWNATAESNLARGTPIIVDGIAGLTVRVRKG